MADHQSDGTIPLRQKQGRRPDDDLGDGSLHEPKSPRRSHLDEERPLPVGATLVFPPAPGDKGDFGLGSTSQSSFVVESSVSQSVHRSQSDSLQASVDTGGVPQMGTQGSKKTAKNGMTNVGKD